METKTSTQKKHAGGRNQTLKENQIRLYDTPGVNRRKDMVTRCQFFESRFYYIPMPDGTIKFIKNRKYYEGRTVQLRKKQDASYVGAIVLPDIKGGIYEIEDYADDVKDRSLITIKALKL